MLLSSLFPRLNRMEQSGHDEPIVWVYTNVLPLCSLCLCGFAFNVFSFYQ